MLDIMGPRIISSMFLALVFFGLYSVNKEKYLGIWSMAWFSWGFAYIARYLLENKIYSPNEIILTILILNVVYFTFWGTLKMVEHHTRSGFKFLELHYIHCDYRGNRAAGGNGHR